MRCFHFGVRRTSVGNLLIIEQFERFDGDLVNLVGKASYPGPGRQLVETTGPIFLRKKLDKHALHRILLLLKSNSAARGEQDEAIALDEMACDGKSLELTHRCRKLGNEPPAGVAELADAPG
jgi:hypothetical protein